MAGINWDSIMKKANACLDTPEKKREIKEIIDAHMLGKVTLIGGNSRGKSGRMSHKTPKEAAEKFIEVLTNEIKSHGATDIGYADGRLGPSAIDSLINIKHGDPYIDGDKYCIDVNFDGELSRPSLAPKKYDGIDNIVALLNSGYEAGHTVFGIWEKHGEDRIASLTSRGGAHFIENAVDNFMDNYSTEYGVEKIDISDTYT